MDIIYIIESGDKFYKYGAFTSKDAAVKVCREHNIPLICIEDYEINLDDKDYVYVEYKSEYYGELYIRTVSTNFNDMGCEDCLSTNECNCGSYSRCKLYLKHKDDKRYKLY